MTGLALCLTAGAAVAEQAAAFAAPTPLAVSATTNSALRVPLALLLVVAMVLGAAWLMRRASGVSRGSTQRMQLIAQLQLGAREKAVIVRVAGQDVLLGVAPGSVRLLLASPINVDADSADRVPAGSAGSESFRDVLRRSIGR